MVRSNQGFHYQHTHLRNLNARLVVVKSWVVVYLYFESGVSFMAVV